MNIRDIAQLANVTPGTVSKVLNNYPDISSSTRQLVLKIIEENQYKPNSYTRQQKGLSSKPSIGLIIEGVDNSLYDTLEEILSIRLHNGNYTIMSYHDNYFAQDKSEKFEELITYTNSNNLNGIIYIGGNFEQIPQDRFLELPCPIVFVNTVLPNNMEETNYSSVQVNHYETAYNQMSYLINKGHKNICTLISSKIDNSVYGIRVKGYANALKDNHLEHNLSYFVEGEYNYKRSYDGLVHLLKQHTEITAICCVADIVCISAIRAIHDVGKVPGKDIEIISFDGLEEINYLVPSISTFVQPVKDLTICIYDLIIGLINRERSPQHITFQAKLITNESCK
ncbi:MAG: LacI family DNA-binding transcriptional regulator [Anaerocolumna aminovalerica]|jgi:DNA-binding LacI/PurR family transcriptional regulator|uniref:LacI family DNA-binding transcriptional regulator n=1 Tax=Anaerocolumna aminovalerica TaxID=1527 RepID=UPI001C0F1445|nr:LacI family DNA-binding transcriptional regulator [Anaerocolumna aminovalerica]MBU5333828.1 LacI family transcriptional regulator [Anaerocolumna aminovalerica]MDU6263121.1 LacI family DNA-binding transcriptional regulator [Anaerocolumna aminovalerica]